MPKVVVACTHIYALIGMFIRSFSFAEVSCPALSLIPGRSQITDYECAHLLCSPDMRPADLSFWVPPISTCFD